MRDKAFMTAKTLMSVEEYLHTSFEGADCEYLDGEVVERNMGNKSHGRVPVSYTHLTLPTIYSV